MVRIMLTLFLVALVPYQTKAETWPDGTPIDRYCLAKLPLR